VKIKINPGLVALLVTALYRMLMATVRIRIDNVEALERYWAAGTPTVVACWHNELFPLPAMSVNTRWVAIVSASKDGEYLSRVLNRLGVDTARGSSSRQGLNALKYAVRAMRQGQGRVNGCVTVDGPRGPRHKAKDGVLLLAQKAGALLVPVRVSYSRKKIFDSWDRFEVPFPFSSCRIVIGEPYAVTDEKLRGEVLAREVATLEERLHALG